LHLTETDGEVHRFPWRERLLRGRFAPRGDPAPPHDFPHFGPIRAVYEQPFIGQTLLGPFVCTHFTFDLDHALVQPIRANVNIAPGFLPGLPPQILAADGIDQAPLGAFRIHVRWRLPPPFHCSLLS
jgi:hypothetical protein